MLGRSLAIVMLYLVPVICSSQECLSRGEIYDYKVGDVFHFIEHGEWVTWPWGYYDKLSNIQIIGKTFSGDMDTVHYVMSVKQNYRNTQNPEWEYAAIIEHYYYHHLYQAISCDTTYINNLYNGRPISYLFYYTHGVIAQIEEEYAAGCGLVSLYEEDIDPERKFIRTKSLVYFKKDEELWGEPIYLTGIGDDDINEQKIAIFPNPARDNLYIDSDSQIGIKHVQIYNNHGEIVVTTVEQLENISISHLSTGWYIVKITGDDWTVSRKLIVQ